jgi:nucleoside-diphosphate-sugar epimerase
MKVLVTGATGFIGWHLIERLASENYHVRALALPQIETSALDRFRAEIVRGDVLDDQSLKRRPRTADSSSTLRQGRKRPDLPEKTSRRSMFREP